MATQVENTVDPKNTKVGITNFGGKTWYFQSDGLQSFIDVGASKIVDYRTFKESIEALPVYELGYIIRDDSLVPKYEQVAPDTKIPLNAISDEQISALLEKEKKCIDYINKVTSALTLKRLLKAAESAKMRANIVEACNDRLFLVVNKLPENFWSLSRPALKSLINDNMLPIIVDAEDEDDDIRNKIANYYGAE